MIKKSIYIYILICIISGNIAILKAQSEDSNEFYLYEGKFIRHIYINVLDIGGPAFNDSLQQDTSWLGSIANFFHFKTKDWVVRQTLLFNEGDLINQNVLYESERLLRGSGPFSDARIYVSPPASISQDSVDIIVTTKDKWTLGILLSYNAETRNSYFGFKDDNIAGLGHRINAQVSLDQDKSIGFGTDLHYLARNVLGYYTDIELNLHNDKKNKTQNVAIYRPFFSTETDIAGGLDITFQRNRIDYFNLAGTPTSTSFKYNSQDLWIGRSFKIGFGPVYFSNRTRIITAVRFYNKNFTIRPVVTPTYNRIFENSTMLLASVGFINLRYYKDVYIESFGITEDVPIGGILNFTAGNEKRDFSKRNYYGVEAVYSRRINELGYTSGKVSVAGFYNKDHWEQNTINLNFIYHTILFRSNNWTFRGFLQNDFVLGYSRFMGEEIYLSNENSIRGIDKFILHGTKSGILNLEARIFSPYSLWGFKFGVNVFADLGIINGRQQNLFSSPLFQAYGFGIRTRNESISRAELVINLIYNPNYPGINKGNFSILLKSSIVMGIRQFGINKPSVINYGEN